LLFLHLFANLKIGSKSDEIRDCRRTTFYLYFWKTTYYRRKKIATYD